MKAKFTIIFILLIIILGGCRDQKSNITGSANNKITKNDSIKIGFSMDHLFVERWQRDRDIFVAKANELGAEVIVQNANNNSKEQQKQIEYLLEQDIDVLVIVPHDANKASSMVEMAKRRGVNVVSYDRLVRNANIDLYISFDNIKVGELMAEKLVKEVPMGNYLIVNGAPSDYNCTMFNQGYKNILKKHDKDINIVDEYWTENWLIENAFNYVDKKLEEKKIDAIIAANDAVAGAVIEVLAEKRLAGKVKVVGHDAALAACQRVVEGTQLLTIYKPIDKIAKKAAELSVKIAKGKEIAIEQKINNGTYQIPYYKIEPIAITRENMDIIIKDGFHRREDIYRNIKN